MKLFVCVDGYKEIYGEDYFVIVIYFLVYKCILISKFIFIIVG